MDKKVCSKCGIEKDITEFQFRKDTNSYRNQCKSCCNELKKNSYRRLHPIKEKNQYVPPKQQICIKCNTKKEIAEFELRNDTGKYRNICKECQRKQNNKYYSEHYEEIRKKQNQYGKEYRKKNKERLSEIGKLYYQNHKNEIKIRHKKNNAIRYQLKKDIILEYSKNYKRLHKDEIRIKINEYEKSRKKVDPLFKLRKQSRTLINQSLTAKGYKKKTKTEQIIGCQIDFFINYLMGTFKTNYGYEWDGIEEVHIDHIIPLATAKNEEEVIKLCHYTNLQLLKAQDNLEKHDKLDWKLNNE